MHVRLGDIFDCDRDIEIPCTNSLVVGCSNEPSVLVHESNGVDWSQVLIIFLRDLACSYVILGGQADVNDVNREATRRRKSSPVRSSCPTSPPGKYFACRRPGEIELRTESFRC